MELLDYAVAIGHEIEATPYCEELGIVSHWHAHFMGCEVIERGGLLSTFGMAELAEDALADYANTIAGKLIVFHSHNSEKRQEFKAPDDLVHTPNYRRPVTKPAA